MISVIAVLLSGCNQKEEKEAMNLNTTSFSENVSDEIVNAPEQHAVKITVGDINNFAGAVEIDVQVKNESSESIYVSPSDFTISNEYGSTVNLHNDSYTTFDSISLQPNQSTSGKLQVSLFSAENYTILNYNGSNDSQQVPIKIISWEEQQEKYK